VRGLAEADRQAVADCEAVRMNHAGPQKCEFATNCTYSIHANILPTYGHRVRGEPTPLLKGCFDDQPVRRVALCLRDKRTVAFSAAARVT
jgi:hypothetical protein